jgi:hypothetical protein
MPIVDRDLLSAPATLQRAALYSFEPPSTRIVSPVVHRASSDARKAPAPAMSSGTAMCFKACIASVESRPASVFVKLDISVSVGFKDKLDAGRIAWQFWHLGAGASKVISGSFEHP